MHDSLPVPPSASAESHPRAPHGRVALATPRRAATPPQAGDRWVEATGYPDDPWTVAVTAWVARAAPAGVVAQPVATWTVDAARLTPALAEAFELIAGALYVPPSDR